MIFIWSFVSTLKNITQEDKKIEIKREHACMSECIEYKTNYEFYYKLLLFLNETIWNMPFWHKPLHP